MASLIIRRRGLEQPCLIHIFSMAVTSAIPTRRAIGVYQCEVRMKFLLIWRINARYAFQSAKNRVVEPELANHMTIPQR